MMKTHTGHETHAIHYLFDNPDSSDSLKNPLPNYTNNLILLY